MAIPPTEGAPKRVAPSVQPAQSSPQPAVKRDKPTDTGKADDQARNGVNLVTRGRRGDTGPDATPPVPLQDRGGNSRPKDPADGRNLDRTPPAKRDQLGRQQDKLERDVDVARRKTPKDGIDPAYDRTQADIQTRAKFWKGRDKYVDPSGKVYKVERFDDISGDLTITRKDTINNRPSDAEVREARQGQRALRDRIDNVTEPEGQNPDVPAPTNADEKARRLTARYYSNNPIRVDNKGNFYEATVDPQSGAVSFQIQPNKITITETTTLAIDGSHTTRLESEGKLPDGRGSVEAVRAEEVDKKGRIIRGTERSDYSDIDGPTITEELRFGRDGRSISRTSDYSKNDYQNDANVHTEERYDKNGNLAHSVSTQETRRRTEEGGYDPVETRATTTTLDFKDGVPTSSTSHTEYNNIEDPAEHVNVVSDGSISYDAKGRPIKSETTSVSTTTDLSIANVDSTTTDTLTTVTERGGKPIFSPQGEPLATPQEHLRREFRESRIDEGQDEDHDAVTTVTQEARTDPATGKLVFDTRAQGRLEIEGKDGDTGEDYELAVDPKTGAISGEPIGVDEFDDRSNWRKFKDTGTKVATVVGAVAATALLVAAPFSFPATGAAWTAAVANTVVLASTVHDVKTGRNHATNSDAVLAAIGTLPGLGGATGRFIGGTAKFDGALVRGGRLANVGPAGQARLADTAAQFRKFGKPFLYPGAVGNATYASLQVENIRAKIANGEPLSPLDVLKLTAAGGRLKFSRDGVRERGGA